MVYHNDRSYYLVRNMNMMLILWSRTIAGVCVLLATNILASSELASPVYVHSPLKNWVGVGGALLPERPALLQCFHKLCRFISHSNYNRTNGSDGIFSNYYEVEGNTVEIYLSDILGFSSVGIYCKGVSVLDSPAMPRARTDEHVSEIILENCPLPAGSSLLNTITKLNLESIKTLKIKQEKSFDAEVMLPTLRELMLESPATKLLLYDLGQLEKLSLDNWVELLPSPVSSCKALLKMHLKTPQMRALPADWLGNCTNLQELVIEGARTLTTLPWKMFSKGSPLTRFSLREGALEVLPERLLDYLPNLELLEFDGNFLKTFPISYSGYRRVLKMNLSRNDLDGKVLRNLVPYPAYEITELDLSHNPRISDDDVCPNCDYSVLRYATSLKKLYLSGTGMAFICKDWQEKMKGLNFLDLSNTNITMLAFRDLQFQRSEPSEVLLRGLPVKKLVTTYKDFNSTLSSFTTVYFDAELECDCNMYWTRRALDPYLHMLDHVYQLRCVGGGQLRDMSPDDMVCLRREECTAAQLPKECECGAWADDHPNHDPRLIRVRCENGSLDYVPRLPGNSTSHLYELLLAHNNITKLHSADLRDNIKGLDLRNNSLTRVDEETALKLGHVSGILRLTGNPLECDCNIAPLLRALHARIPGDTDLGIATCRDGTMLYAVPIVDCPKPVLSNVALISWLTGILAAMLMAIGVIVVYLASRQRRYFLLAVLNRWGIVWRTAERKEDNERSYDAFLTFSHKDEAVAYEIMKRLEPTYRLCLHHRDWTPGDYIIEQVMESVRDSRRTVALVSRHFLESKWARVEFREAHTAAMLDARPRLIVVLLEQPAALPLDEQLHLYLRTNTYVLWDDPSFWDKLKLALPPPRLAFPSALKNISLPQQDSLHHLGLIQQLEPLLPPSHP